MYTCLVLAYPQYAHADLQEFIQKVVAAGKTKLIFVGNGQVNFDGEVMPEPHTLAPNAPYFALRPEIGDLTAYLSRWGIRTNRVPSGCVMQDGSVVITASAPDMPVGNKLHSQFILDDTQITVDGTDVVCLRKDNQQLQYWSPHEVCIKEERV